ncbi:MAG: 2-C-methyl-D-erythritol 4-phosphate cytidylyltransferase [Proteobacteria bacterium]|nr:2-C-methyl-D-erythritol 4-phosphate cytidylyltransferase [Pseudomonadota bacterium]
MNYWLVMPAAGTGRRFGTELPKQYAPLEGRTVIDWALSSFLADARCAQIIVALGTDDGSWTPPAGVRTTTGGAQRSQSVRAGLAALEGSARAADWVLVHDAARPCLSAQDLERLLAGAGQHPVGGLLGVRYADTLKRADESRGDAQPAQVLRTEERRGLWRALTPQMFRYGALCAALDAAHAAGRFPSDEAQAMEWAGAAPLLIEGAASNLKVTAAEDLLLAAAVLRARRAA